MCFGYNPCMVALTNITADFPQTALRGRAQNHRYRLGAEPCSKSNSQANLREATYDECKRLGSCSKDPIGYDDGPNSYENFFLVSNLDPSGTRCALTISALPYRAKRKKERSPGGAFSHAEDFYLQVERKAYRSADLSHGTIHVQAVATYTSRKYWSGKWIFEVVPATDTGTVECYEHAPCDCRIQANGGTPDNKKSKVKSSSWTHAVSAVASVSVKSTTASSATFEAIVGAGMEGSWTASTPGATIKGLPVPSFSWSGDTSQTIGGNTEPITFTCEDMDKWSYLGEVLRNLGQLKDMMDLESEFNGPSQPESLP